jgi:hypothetical protein
MTDYSSQDKPLAHFVLKGVVGLRVDGGLVVYVHLAVLPVATLLRWTVSRCTQDQYFQK